MKVKLRAVVEEKEGTYITNTIRFHFRVNWLFFFWRKGFHGVADPYHDDK